MSEQSVGTANGKYRVLLTVQDGLATPFVNDVAKGAKARTGFGRTFVRSGIDGQVSLAPLPTLSSAADLQRIKDNKLLVETSDVKKLHRAVFFNPRKKEYNRRTRVIGFQIA